MQRRMKTLPALALMLASLAVPALALERLAVLDLRAQDDRVDARDVAQIGDELRTQIVVLGSRRGTFRCLDRQEMESRLREMAFSLTDCVDNECVLEVGRALTAKKMVAGQVGKVGTLFRISAHLLDVETGEIAQAASVQITGGIEEVLRTGVPQIVAKLFGLAEPTPTRPPAPEPSRPTVQPPATTDAADLFAQAGKAYTAGRWLEALRLYERVDALEPGNPVVAMRIKECATKADEASKAAEYEAWRQDALRKRDFYVETARGLLNANRSCEAGKYVLLAFAGDWQWKQGRDLVEDVLWKSSTPDQCCDADGAFSSLSLDAKYINDLKQNARQVCAGLKPGSLVIEVSEEGASVALDGSRIGASPLPARKVKAGSHQIAATKQGFQDARTTAVVSPGATVTASLRLVPDTGAADILSTPTGARVVVNGVEIGVTPLQGVRLPVGRQPITLTMPRHESWSGWLDLGPERATRLSETLLPKTKGKALARSAALPGWGQRYMEHPGRGWAYTVVQIAAVGAAVYGYSAHSSALDEYDEARAAFVNATAGHEALWETMEAKHQEATDTQKTANLTMSLALGIYLWNLADALLF
ncbi:PEGA domain-containing protein [Candidatus Fermentibacteria bacterium]|nr:PEGA domain-containing protein [Candidatus Fermentibacteria bacterium]